MFIYLNLYLWTVLLQALYFVNLNNKKIIYFILVILPMIIIAGLRSNSVGIDTGTVYYNIFNSVDCNLLEMFDKEELKYVEKLYLIINWIIFKATGSYTVLLFIISAITNTLIFYVICKISNNIYFSVSIYLATYCYFGSLCHMRQYLALSFIVLTFYLLLNKKTIKAIITLCISLAFHTSSVFVIPIFILWYYLHDYRKYIFIILGVILSFVICLYYFEYIVLLFPKYSAIYVNSAYGESRNFTASIFLAIISLIYLIFNIIYDYLKKIPFSQINAFYNLVILIYALLWIASYKIFIINRLVIEFQIFLCLAIPYIKTRYFHDNLYFNLIINFFMFIYLFLHFSKNTALIVPYTTSI